MFERTRNTSKKTFRYVKDDVLNVKEAQGHFDDAKALLNEHYNPRNKKAARNETFANAMERKGLTEDDIASSYKHYSVRFYIFLFFFSFAGFVMCWSAFNLQWTMAGPAFAAALICLGQMFNASFRCFQIRNHEFLPVSTWLQRRDQWWPADYLPPRVRSSRSVARRKDS